MPRAGLPVRLRPSVQVSYAIKIGEDAYLLEMDSLTPMLYATRASADEHARQIVEQLEFMGMELAAMAITVVEIP
jgi:hypothetical protein